MGIVLFTFRQRPGDAPARRAASASATVLHPGTDDSVSEATVLGLVFLGDSESRVDSARPGSTVLVCGPASAGGSDPPAAARARPGRAPGAAHSLAAAAGAGAARVLGV